MKISTSPTAAFMQGRSDFSKGVVVGANPYREDDGAYWYWLDGWSSAGLSKLKNQKQEQTA